MSDRTEMRDLNKFATARWSRDADIVTIARCILGTLKYEPHTCDVTALRQVLEGVIEGTQRERGREVRPDTGGVQHSATIIRMERGWLRRR